MTDYYTMAEATRITGFTRSRIIDIAEKAGVTVVDGITADIVNDIVREKETYIILNDKIPDKVYEDVCLYATQKIAVSGQHASKTAGTKAPPLTITIEPALATFFGLLTLISEAVMMRTGDGYMRSNRARAYQKKSLYKQFFGQDMYDALHGQNIHSRRLNKR